MRVNLITDRFYLGGGIEHIFQIIKGMPEIEFSLFAKPGEAEKKFLYLNNVNIHNQGYSPSRILSETTDLIHFHHLKPLTVFFKNPFRGVRKRVPIIFTAHGLHIHKYEFINTLAAKVKYLLRFKLEKRLFKRVDKVISVSKEDKVFLETNYHLSNVSYLTNGIDASKLHKVDAHLKTELRKRLGLPQKGLIFITIARFNFQKGYDILIKAISRIKNILNDIKSQFLFVGDGSLLQEMKDLSNSLSVSPFIKFLGARTDAYDLLNASDICLLPSRWEGLPIVLIESGFLNIPVIASDTYGNHEIIQESNGILFQNQNIDDLAEKLKMALLNQYDLPKYSTNLFQEVKTNYALGKMLKGLESIYKNCSNNL
jgi:glycosyltransferase involved in cell wall biosynthesis